MNSARFDHGHLGLNLHMVIKDMSLGLISASHCHLYHRAFEVLKMWKLGIQPWAHLKKERHSCSLPKQCSITKMQDIVGKFHDSLDPPQGINSLWPLCPISPLKVCALCDSSVAPILSYCSCSVSTKLEVFFQGICGGILLSYLDLPPPVAKGKHVRPWYKLPPAWRMSWKS